jgi:hypothetical protein
VTIHDLPDEVLLEIFDLYRQTFGDQLRVWNNKNGWFKLAHVCHNWRSIVLASPSRLQLRLYFADNTPTRAVVLERLSNLPIIVDFSDLTWNVSARMRLMSALRYPDRVCRIAIMGTHDLKVSGKITEALDLPFPALETLELYDMDSLESIFLATSLMTSIQSLRHLLVGADLTSVLPLLSVTRALVDLTLSVDTVVWLTKGASLLPHLQHMPNLRNLQVTTSTYFSPSWIVERPPIKSVSLAELACFHFFGDCAQMEWFVAGLYAPSLRELQISVLDTSGTLHLPYLFNFVRVIGMSFFAARLTISSLLTTSLFAHSHLTDDPPSKTVTITTRLAADPGSAFSAMLATLEDIFLSLFIPITQYESIKDHVPWRKFFEEFRSVKVLRLHHGLETQVADMLQWPTFNPLPPQEEVDSDTTTPSGTPINSSRNQVTLDIFPSLEEIVVYARTPDTSIDESASVQTVLRLFGPFVTARHEVGRPVKVYWKTDGEVPSFTLTDPRYFTT